MAQNININISLGQERDIILEYKKGILKDTVQVTNVSGNPFQKIKLLLTLGDAKKKDRINVWRNNESRTYTFWLQPTVKKITLDLESDGTLVFSQAFQVDKWQG